MVNLFLKLLKFKKIPFKQFVKMIVRLKILKVSISQD